MGLKVSPVLVGRVLGMELIPYLAVSLQVRGVESESPRVRVLARIQSLSFEGDFDSGPYLFHMDF